MAMVHWTLRMTNIDDSREEAVVTANSDGKLWFGEEGYSVRLLGFAAADNLFEVVMAFPEFVAYPDRAIGMYPVIADGIDIFTMGWMVHSITAGASI